MSNNSLNRRHFLKNMGIASMALPLGGYAKSIAPSDKLRIAHIGVNGMGQSHMHWFAKLPEVETVALCDVDAKNLAKAKKGLDDQKTNKAELYADFRRILDRKDIDAVTYASPDHWHAAMCIMSMQAGKHVYGEKPLSYTLQEGRMMLEAQKKYGKTFQLGTQIHAGDNYHRVAELLQAGVIGKVKKVKLWKPGGSPIFEKLTIQKPPAHFDYDMWLGPAPWQEYVPEKTHFTYRYFIEFSGGVFQDFWCHIADIVWMSLKPHGLKTIKAEGGLGKGLSTTPDWINIKYQFENLILEWTTNPPDMPNTKDKYIGAYFEGDGGTLVCDYGGKNITINGETVYDFPQIGQTIARSPGHQQNFVDAIKNNTVPESNLAYAHEMTAPMHLGLISWKLGNKLLKWDAQKEQFTNSAKANDMLFRPYRKGYDWV